MAPHGRVIWSELNTHTPEAAKAFFVTTLGWSFEGMPMEGGDTYWIIKNEGERVGGVFTMSGPPFEGVPDHWLTYIGVDDVDSRAALAAKSGGTVMRQPWTIPGVGRVAILKAAGGAVMAWMTPVPPQA